jgi:chorismate mutase
MIDLKTLPITHQWGLANAVRKANIPIEQENAAIEARNAGKEEADKEPLKTLYTVQSYTDERVEALFEKYWQQARQDGLQEQIIPRLMSLQLEEEFALRAQFQIPNLIPDDLLDQLPKP